MSHPIDIAIRYTIAETRLNVLHNLYRLAHWQDSVSKENGKELYRTPFVRVWEGLLEYEDILNDPIVLGKI